MPGVRLLACIEDMSWAKFAIEKLKKGEAVQIRPRDHSMKGKVDDGDLVTVEPCQPEELSIGDIVLVRVKGNDYLHLIKAVNQGRFLIGDNRGGVNGWVGHNCIYGVATKVEPK
jgi:SOS-response transcriptional repressor LexA